MSMFDVLWMLHQQQQIGAATVTATIAATDAQAQELIDRGTQRPGRAPHARDQRAVGVTGGARPRQRSRPARQDS